MELPADLAARLTRLEDVQQIRDLKMRYARFADAGYDADGLASLFAPDAVWDGGALFGRAEGTEAIRVHFRGAPERIPWALHYVLAPELSLDADGVHASGTWYLWQPCTRRRRSGEEHQAWLAGTYRDTYVRLADGWRFQTVEVRARWLEAPPSTLPAG